MYDLLMMSKGEMDSLGKLFAAQSAEVGDLLATMSRALEGTTWQGARADRFRALWSDTFAPNLVALQQSLTDNASFIGAELANASTAFDHTAG